MSRVRWLTERISTITVKFSPFAVPCPYPVMLLSISSLLLEIPRHASLPARSSGERRIDRNQTFPKSPRLRRATIACNPAHPALSAPWAQRVFRPLLRTGSDAYPGAILITLQGAASRPKTPRRPSSAGRRPLPLRRTAVHKACGKRRRAVATRDARPFRRRSEERRVGKECRSRWSSYH